MARHGILTVVSDGTSVELPIAEGMSVLDVLSDAGVGDIHAPCGGNGLCGKCLVQEVGEHFLPLHPDEQRLLSTPILEQHIRLACRMRPDSGQDVTIALISSKKQAKVVSQFQDRANTGQGRQGFPAPSYGYAVDIGTTTVVVYLARLDTGEVIDHRSALNPQASYGGDVITRIQYTNEHPGGLKLLQKSIVGHLGRLMKDLMKTHRIEADTIREIVVVGNPTMIHLLAGKDPSGIAVAPFVTTITGSLALQAAEVGFADFPHASLILPGGVSAYIGSDVTVGVRSSRLMDGNLPVLYIDIGTNGEIALFDGKNLHCCSSAAGPAFEGASIAQGMGAVEGAIDRVWLDEEGVVAHSTIGGAPAVGICGSAIIDILALLLDSGLVDETGAMDDEHPLAAKYLTTGNGGLAFRITDTVGFTHGDVRQVQLAKAAIAAGAAVLLSEAQLDVSALGSVVIAGGFGSFINAVSAKRIGLLPQIATEKIIAIGNAAGRGALDVLLMEEEAANVELIRERAHYIELSSSSLFNEYYVEEMMFMEGSH
ncbi:MAG TPA: ASKHA domain-containing protein [Sphaerochaeta sp.]|nr:ASKHA domain-containing protein [Sphaerochaeta sp.]